MNPGRQLVLFGFLTTGVLLACSSDQEGGGGGGATTVGGTDAGGTDANGGTGAASGTSPSGGTDEVGGTGNGGTGGTGGPEFGSACNGFCNLPLCVGVSGPCQVCVADNRYHQDTAYCSQACADGVCPAFYECQDIDGDPACVRVLFPPNMGTPCTTNDDCSGYPCHWDMRTDEYRSYCTGSCDLYYPYDSCPLGWRCGQEVCTRVTDIGSAAIPTTFQSYQCDADGNCAHDGALDCQAGLVATSPASAEPYCTGGCDDTARCPDGFNCQMPPSSEIATNICVRGG